MFVVRVVGGLDDGGVVGDDSHPLAVGRDMRKPVLHAVAEDLFLTGAVGLHSENLHEAGARGVEVNPLAVGRKLGAVIEGVVVGELDLLLGRDVDLVDVPLIFAIGGVNNPLVVRRPSVQVGIAPGRVGDLRGIIGPGHGQGEDGGFAVGSRVVGDGEQGAVKGQHVVVVVLHAGSGVEGFDTAGCEVKGAQHALGWTVARDIHDQLLAVGGPVGGLEGFGAGVDGGELAGEYVEDLHGRAEVVAIRAKIGGGRFDDAHVAEERLLGDVGVVRTKEEPDVDAVG